MTLVVSESARLHPHGYGYWVWKPWVILQVMKQVKPGDVVFYLDAGCTEHTSSTSRLRYEWYIERIRRQGTLLFQQKYREFNWTKRDAIEYFRLNDDDIESGQILGGVQGIGLHKAVLSLFKPGFVHAPWIQAGYCSMFCLKRMKMKDLSSTDMINQDCHV